MERWERGRVARLQSGKGAELRPNSAEGYRERVIESCERFVNFFGNLAVDDLRLKM